MELKLKQTIRCKGVQHRQPKVIDTVELGISDAEAKILISRGVADLHVATAASTAVVASVKTEQPAQATGQPEVTNLELGSKPEEAASAEVVQAAEVPVTAPAAPEVTNLDLGGSAPTEIEGQLAGVVDANGESKSLEDLTRDELLEIATGMELSINSRATKAQIIEAIQAEKVTVADGTDADTDTETDHDAGAGE